MDGEEVRMVIMYVVAYFNKHSILTSGKGTVVGENMTVSQVHIIFAQGK